MQEHIVKLETKALEKILNLIDEGGHTICVFCPHLYIQSRLRTFLGNRVPIARQIKNRYGWVYQFKKGLVFFPSVPEDRLDLSNVTDIIWYNL